MDCVLVRVVLHGTSTHNGELVKVNGSVSVTACVFTNGVREV